MITKKCRFCKKEFFVHPCRKHTAKTCSPTCRNAIHGHAGKHTKIYNIWSSMLYRCRTTTSKVYKLYGGRGIKVCKRWKKFENFLADMGEKPEGMSIERTNNDKGYFPENCKWATRKEQSNNTRQIRLVTFNGKTMNVTQWAEELKMPRGIIYKRLDRGWNPNKVFTT